MKRKRLHILIAIAIILTGVSIFRRPILKVITPVIQIIKGKHTVAQRLEQYGPAVRERLLPDFKRIGINYPPDKITFIAIKDEKKLELWISDPPKRIKTYPILKASGTLGPKLKEGDRQVPEGLYQIESLNPNSLYHLSLRINYPNAFDKAMAQRDSRTNLGGDIMIHGNNVSIGCLAMGNQASEDLFILAAETGLENISVIITPTDFRKNKLPNNAPNLPAWSKELYDSIKTEIDKFPYN